MTHLMTTQAQSAFEKWWNSYPQERSTELDRKANSLSAWQAAIAEAKKVAMNQCHHEFNACKEHIAKAIGNLGK